MTTTVINLTLIPQTDQEAFDMVVAHLRTRPSRAWQPPPPETDDPLITGMCVYRLNRDPASPVRCGIGCLIPDDQYDPDMEGKGVQAFMSYDARWGFTIRTEISQTLLIALQNIHDEAENWDEHGFINEGVLAETADRRNLTYTSKGTTP